MRRREWFLWLCVLLVTSFAASFGAGCNCDESQGVDLTAQIKVTPENIVFGAIEVGETSSKSTVVENIGRAALTISSIAIVNESGGDAYILETKVEGNVVLEPGESKRLIVRYEPKEAGSATGYIRIISDASNTDSTEGLTKVNLRAAQVAGDIVVEPNPVDFGAVKPEDEASKDVKIINRGQADLVVNSMAFKDNKEKQFRIDSQLTMPLTLKPGDTASFKILYKPRTATAEEILLINNNTSDNGEYEVRIVGKMAAPNIEVVPAKVVFTSVFLGAKGTKKFVIKNTGGTALEIKDMVLDSSTSPDFSLVNPPQTPFSIEPGKEKEIEVGYNSSDTNDDMGKINISSNDPDSPLVHVQLEAAAKGCNFVPIPVQLVFTNKSIKTVKVVNQGNEVCKYTGASLAAGTSNEFTITTAPPAQDVGPNQSLEFKVQFDPTDGTDDTGALVIESDDADNPKLEVKLISKVGSAQECEVRLSPTTLQFGFVGTGRSRILSTILTNDGYGNCTIQQANINPNPSNAFALRTNIPSGGQTVPSGGTFQFEVSFTPTTASKFEGKLLIVTNDTKTPQAQVSLLGSSGNLCIEALPDPMDFGSVKVNCSSPKEKMELFNICNSQASVTGIKFGPSRPSPDPSQTTPSNTM